MKYIRVVKCKQNSICSCTIHSIPLDTMIGLSILIASVAEMMTSDICIALTLLFFAIRVFIKD